ncbi:hypothetical protein AAFG13_07650 [Bradyrhizobium sp. B124]|uniref:hypothetical protein n=1 Tax=Bradyrhizobium sp. B124 TaxID=3140245 RepID=UPI003182CBC5
MVSYIGDHQHSDTERHSSAILTVIDMKTLEEVKNEYEHQVEMFLHNHPVELESFKELWARANFGEHTLWCRKSPKDSGL